MQPVTVGVFDDSGSKTRIMQILERDLSPENWKEGSLEAIRCRNAAVVYINTWQFEGCEDAKAVILSSELLQLRVSANPTRVRQELDVPCPQGRLSHTYPRLSHGRRFETH